MNNAKDQFAGQRILIIDDDAKLCRLVRDYLAPMGFEVEIAHTGPRGLEMAIGGDYRAVLLDVMLPGMDGFEVLRQIRRVSSVPVLMLTALGDESDRIVGLELGADDYLPKTFSTRELLARLRAVTRRSTITANQTQAQPVEEILAGELRISAASRRASLAGEALVLTPLEFDLLLALALSADRVMSRDRLLDEISNRNYEVFDRSIDVHISSLRRKLGDDPKNPRYIRTVRSAGYMLIHQGEEL
ncbi:MAG: response regulator transcription factor [Blastocatellia bacterium]